MNQFPTKAQVERIKEKYPTGTRVQLDSMNDPYPIPVGTQGTVIDVDDMAQILVSWDNGSSLSLIPNVDSFHIVQQDLCDSFQPQMSF